MKKVLVGLLSLILIGQVSFAQPVSDMAVIPMGITIQSVMRLSITKGGNIEFVFKSAGDIANGIPSAGFTTAYETSGTVTASQNWEMELNVDETDFIGEDGATTLALNVVELQSSVTPANTLDLGAIPLQQNIPNLYNWANAGTDNLGGPLDFTIQWRCGHTNAIPGGQSAQRYAANIILTLAPYDGL